MSTAHPAANRLVLAALLLCLGAAAATVEFRRGVWAASDLAEIPLPTSGYQLYLVGELHGVQENVSIFEAYLERLVRAGLRDVAIEEDSVYERSAEAYVSGRSDAIPGPLCLRAGVLDVVRRMNLSHPSSPPVRVRLVDIDSPASAIQQHLASLVDRVPAGRSIAVPAVSEIKQLGLPAVERLKRLLPADRRLQGELRTVEYSLRAYLDGFELGDTFFRGSSYLEPREEAIAANLRDVLALRDGKGVLVQYGSDHISKVERKDGGPHRDSLFAPMALRLERSGVTVFSLLTVPLSGAWQWRGRQGDLFWSPSDASLSTREPLDQVLAATRHPAFLYIDPKRERPRLPSQDLNGFRVDAYLLFSTATLLHDRCTVAKQ